MSDLAETLWREFAVETEEHFEIIEPLLIAGETDVLGPEDIAQLFRSFHSIKGMFRSLDMRTMEAMAHRAENLLGLVRDGRCAMDCEAIGLLIETLDALKSLRETAVIERRNMPLPGGLIERLDAAYAARSAQVAVVAGNAATPPASSPGTDPQMLHIYAEVMEQHLPVIAHMATAEIANPQARNQALLSIDALLHGSEVMELAGLTAVLETLRDLIEAPPSGETKLRVARILGDLHGEKKLLMETAPDDGIALPLPAGLNEALAVEMRSILDDMSAALARYRGHKLAVEHDPITWDHAAAIEAAAKLPVAAPGEGTRSDHELADEMLLLVRAAYALFVILDLKQAPRLALMLEDIFARIANREMGIHPRLLDLTDEVVKHLAGGSGELDAAAVDLVLSRFRDVLMARGEEASGSDLATTLEHVLAGHDIADELIEILTPENIQALIEAVQGGHGNLYQITADLDASHDLALAFMRWIRKDATSITNRTVFLDGRTWLEFLVVSDMPLAGMQAGADAIDPGCANVRIKLCWTKTELAAPKPAPAESPPPAIAAKEHGSLRVRSETVDRLVTHLGEMVTVGNALQSLINDKSVEAELNHLRSALFAANVSPEVMRSLDAVANARRAQARIGERLAGAVSRLQDAAIELRVVPIGTIFSRFPRVVRDLAQAHGKLVRLEMEGAEIHIDKGMVDLLLDPLMHMVRNAIDHGIEPPEVRRAAGKSATASIQLKASSRSNLVMIEILDDGYGMDADIIRRQAVAHGLVSAEEAARLSDDEAIGFIFKPGFSTSAQVTETSGRGVGLDVAHTNILRLGGHVDVKTVRGIGTTFKFQLPLSAAIQRVLIVEAAGRTVAIAERFLVEIRDVGDGDIQNVQGRQTIHLRNASLPIFKLADLLGFGAETVDGQADRRRPLIVLVNGRQRMGIEVDRLHRREGLFITDVHPRLAALPGFGGASITDDGQVVLIIDGEQLFRLADRSAIR